MTVSHEYWEDIISFGDGQNDREMLRMSGIGRSSAMDESLTEQRRVSEEGFRIVKLCC